MSESITVDPERFDLCIVGAGIAGLNAAFVASQYLPTTARVLLLDKHQQAGGMWNDGYSYVRLHQPYQFFTAGNIKWSLEREPGYLATRDEVMDHLRHCLRVISERFDLDARWGWELLEHGEEGEAVVVMARDPEGAIHRFTSDRFIDAIGFDIESLHPLPVTSQRVRSISPCELGSSGLLGTEHHQPVWVVGSGKTAMDTIIALLKANPTRKVGMVSGTGTYFVNRDDLYRTGMQRWTGGELPNGIFADVANRFDGTNTAAVREWFVARHGISPLPDAIHNSFGILSEDESATVESGVHEVVRDRLVDVVDTTSGPVLLLRSGVEHPVEAGSWVVNCTSHLAPRLAEHTPYVSPSGSSMSVNSTSMTLGFSSTSAYFLTHLFFLDKLADAPLYELDLHALRADAMESVPVVLCTLILYNLSIVFERVPPRVFQQNGLDFDRWYPFPRRLIGTLRFIRRHKRDALHHRQALDVFSRESGVRCGPLAVSPGVAVTL